MPPNVGLLLRGMCSPSHLPAQTILPAPAKHHLAWAAWLDAIGRGSMGAWEPGHLGSTLALVRDVVCQSREAGRQDSWVLPTLGVWSSGLEPGPRQPGLLGSIPMHGRGLWLGAIKAIASCVPELEACPKAGSGCGE